jgi:hypothetical protein
MAADIFEFPQEVVSRLLDKRTLRAVRTVYLPTADRLAAALPPIVTAYPRVTFLLAGSAPEATAELRRRHRGRTNVRIVPSFDPFAPRLTGRPDLVFLLVPFGTRSTRIPADSTAGRHLDAYMIEQLAQCLPAGARLLAVAGAATLFVQDLERFRTRLASKFTVNSIRVLPAQTLAPWSSVKLCVLDLLIRPPRPRHRCEVVAYSTARPITRRAGFINNAVLEKRATIDSELLLHSPIWSLESLFPPGGGNVAASLRSGVPTVPLGEVVERVFGGIYLRAEETWSGERGATHALVGVGNIQEGRLAMDSPRWLRITDRRRSVGYEVRAGDLVIAARGTVIKMAVVPPYRKPLIISGNVVAVRTGDKYDSTCLRVFLEGPAGMRLLEGRMRTSYVTVISPRDLLNLPVPVLALSEQRRIAVAVVKAETRARAAVARALQRRDRVLQRLRRALGQAPSVRP